MNCMIYTLTTNPAIDMNIQSKKIKSSVVNRVENSKYFPNGKGINVSLVLKKYGINSKVLGFFGGFTGKFIKDELESLKFEVKPVWINHPTRINVFINDEINEFKLVDKGPFITEFQQQELLNVICSLTDCKYLVISGSLPPGIDDSYYDKIFQICKAKYIDVIIDISSSKLKGLLKFNPLLIKPNDEEIKDIFGIEIKNESDVRYTFDTLHDMGARNILLTMGDKGLYFSDGKKALYCGVPKIKLLSSACAGDAALGAFLSEWIVGKDLKFALKKASATGANVAESEGLGLLDNVDNYIKQIKVRKLY